MRIELMKNGFFDAIYRYVIDLDKSLYPAVLMTVNDVVFPVDRVWLDETELTIEYQNRVCGWIDLEDIKTLVIKK